MARSVAEVAPPALSSAFRTIAEEEARHIEHAIGALQAELAADTDRFERALECLHDEGVIS